MKFIVVGGTQGNIHLINEYAEKSKADVILSVGDFGMFYRNGKLPKSFTNNDFCDYLEGRNEFVKPVIAVRGVHDNLSLCKRLMNGDIKVNNFTLLKNGETITLDNNTEDELNIKKIRIGGVGGSYSPKHYYDEKLVGTNKRHYNKASIDKLSEGNVHILLMHDLIGECSSRKIIFSEDTFDLFNATRPLYALVGKYNWWASSSLDGMNLVSIPYIRDGYLTIDTKNWKAEGVRFDLSIGR